MRSLTGLVALVLSLSPAAAAHASPTPAAGSRFTTTDSVPFVGDPDPEGRAQVVVISQDAGPIRDDGPAWLVLGSDLADNGVDLGSVARDLRHLGTYYWRTCPAADGLPVRDGCSAPLDFHVRFRVADLDDATARASVRQVMDTRFRGYWRGFESRQIVCEPRSRVRRHCEVFGHAGDDALAGVVRIANRRRGYRTRQRFVARLALTDQRCQAFKGSGCTRVRRGRGWVGVPGTMRRWRPTR